MIDTLTPELAAAWFAERLQDARHGLVERWRAALPARELDIDDLITAIAEALRWPPELELARNTRVMHEAAELGVLSFARGSSVPRLLHEYRDLSNLFEEFLQDEVSRAEVPLHPHQVASAMRAVTHSVRLLQEQTVSAFVKEYTETVARQSDQLLALGRLAAHEMRQPLGVLQLLSGMIPIRDDDHEVVRLLDVFDRNVRRLTDVAGRLERLAHESLDQTVVSPRDGVNLGAVVATVVEKLRDLARAHDVRVRVEARLPTLRVDAVRLEMMFVSLIANAIKYSDPAKPVRLVEVESGRGQLQPTVVVRDNGVGMPRGRTQHFFREFSRAHAHRDRDLLEQGLGLGLSIVRSAMDACGGIVLLQSTEGVGTVVTLSWPRRLAPTITPAAR